MNAKQQTVIGIALVALLAMGLCPPFMTCDSPGALVYRYYWIVYLLEPKPECEQGTWELATNRLFFQWVFVMVAAAMFVRVFTGPKSLELLKDYRGATFHFTRYIAPCEDWKQDYCAGCWATFAEYDGPGILHEVF